MVALRARVSEILAGPPIARCLARPQGGVVGLTEVADFDGQPVAVAVRAYVQVSCAGAFSVNAR
jgi:hypothetical protein